MIITINGKPGSGKSSIAQALAAELGYRRYYMGQLRRDQGKRLGLTLSEINALGASERWVDREIDDEVERLGREQDDFIIESRTAWHFIPQSLKVFLDVSLPVGAQRIFRQLQKADSKRAEEANLKTLPEVLQANQERIKSEIERYKKYYNLDIHDQKNYDLWLDTTKLNQDQVFDRILSFVKQALKSHGVSSADKK